MELLSENSEDLSSNESESNESKKSNESSKTLNIFKNMNLIIIRIYNMIQRYPFLYHFLKFKIYILFSIALYYYSNKTSLLISSYLMNNKFYHKIRGIHDIAIN